MGAAVEQHVIVVGAGPVGLTTAYGLAQQGIAVTVLERGDGPGTASRASTFHPASLEFLDELGLAQMVVDNGLHAPTFQHRDRYDGIVAEMDLAVLADETPFPFRVQLEQDVYCRLVAERLAELDHVEVCYGTPVIGVAQHDEGVAVCLEGGWQVTGDWVVGADGAHSAVRRSVGVEQEGFTYGQRFLVISTTHELSDDIPDLSLVNYVSDPDEWYVLLRTPRSWRLLFPIHEGADPDEVTDPAQLQARVAGVVGHDGPFEIVQHSHYEIHQKVATTFRVGRVLLAGDAAHLNNPLGGLGMNTGMADVRSLVDRLGRVCKGEDADLLLDGYSELRRRQALEVTDRETRANMERMGQRDPEARAANQASLRALVDDDEALKAYLRRTTLLEAAREGR